MTSVAGTSVVRQRGFTLVEMLTVLFILTLLIGLVAAGIGGLKERARVKAAAAQLDRLGLHLEAYQKIAHKFPKDGLEDTVETDDGTVLQSGAAMTFALARPTPRYNVDAGGNLERIGVGDPVGEFAAGELYVDPDDENAVELLDPWMNPFHYDRLVKGGASYNIQDSGDVHLQDTKDHGDDPREDTDAVNAIGPQNPRGYDIWSHGPNGHRDNEEAAECIATWPKPTE
ncbi:MAG: type II secretion system protein [Planctomycetota bacterium]